MSFLIVAGWDKDYRITRAAYRDNEADAIKLVSELLDMVGGRAAPDAFYVVDPGVHISHLVADPAAMSVTVDAEGRDSKNALEEIERVEKTITVRRLREAILGIDDGWLAGKEALIATERVKVKKKNK